MSEEFGPNFITLTDEDGNDIELEYVDALELDGQTYMAFFPVVEDDADEEAAEEYGLVKTGGSDFHGSNKPQIALGTGISGTLSVPYEWLGRLKELAGK